MKKSTQQQTAESLTNDNDHYTAVGAKAMVESGRGHWVLDLHFRRQSSNGYRLWRDPNSTDGLGTTPTGEIYE